MVLSKMSPRDRMLLMVVGPALAILLLGRFLYFPNRGKITTLKQEVLLLRKEASVLDDRKEGDKSSLIERELNELGEGVSLQEGMMPDDSKIPSVLEELTTLAKKTRIGFTVFKPEEVQASEVYDILPLRIELRCRYLSLVKFLYFLRDVPGLITVSALHVSGGEGNSLEAKLTFDIHTLKKKEESAETAKPETEPETEKKKAEEKPSPKA